MVGVGIEPTFRVFQTRANPSQLSDRLERAVRLELTNTGFAIQRLSHLATRAVGAEEEIRTLESSLEDSHVSSYITSAWDASQGDPRFLWWGENRLQQNGASYRIRTGVSALATPCLEPTGPTMRNGRGGQSRTVTTSSQDSDANVTPHPEIKIGAPGETRTHTPLLKRQVP